MDEPTKPKYHPFKLLGYFHSKFFDTYKVAYVGNRGRDVRIMTDINNLFKEHEQLGDLKVFIDMCFRHSPTNQINPIFLRAVVNTKLGITKKKRKAKTKMPSESTEEQEETPEELTPEVLAWLEAEKKKV